MKQLATIGAVALLLFIAAIYLQSQTAPIQTSPEPEPVVPNPIFENLEHPITSGTVDGTLQLRSAISNGYIAMNSSQDVYGTIDIQAKKFQGSTRPPLNIALVIDRSGSMSGNKMEQARQAARRLINSLNATDRVSIVSYGSDVTVDFPSDFVNTSTRPNLLQSINRIKVGGGTNLSGGFQRGLGEVRRGLDKFNVRAVNRVILMSDGHANIGLTYAPDLIQLATDSLRNHVSVTTMGVGLDYNEDLMTSMANEGAGNYYFVDRSEQIISFLDKELKGLSTTVAANTAVVIELADGVTLAELYGFPHSRNGNKITIPLSEFYSEQKKSILFKLSANGASKGLKPIYNVKLQYTDVTASDTTKAAALEFKSIATADAQKVASQVNIDVISRVQQVELAKSLQDAMEAYKDGDAAKASNIVRRSRSRVRTSQKKYKFKASKRYDFEINNLDSLEGEFQKNAPTSEKGRGMIKKQKAKSNAILFEAF